MSTFFGVYRRVFSINGLLTNYKTQHFLPTIWYYFKRSYSTRMSSVLVKNRDSDERLEISLDLNITKNNATCVKSFNLNRLKNEELRVAVERLRLNLNKTIAKKSKYKKKSVTETKDKAAKYTEPEEAVGLIPIEIILDGNVVDLSVSNESAWVQGAVLKIWKEEIKICYNPPSVKLEKLPTTIMAGFPLFPEAEFEFADMKSSEFYWEIITKDHFHKITSMVGRGIYDVTNAVKSQSFTPRHNDIGSYILLACVPRCCDKTGKMEITISSCTVATGPLHCPFEKRCEFTQEQSGYGEFRVLSYNILAQIYADTDLARQELFSYCPSPALNMDYRKHLLLKEILGYKADLLCLQEVDKSIFFSQLMPAMQASGFSGYFKAKDGQVSEGCASFVCDKKFRMRNQLDIVLSSFLASDPLCADIWEEVCKVPPLREKLDERTTVLQVTVIESIEKPGNFVCLANTHLYFHPTACNLRLIQAATALRHLQNVCDTYRLEGNKISLIFCGDFNSAPHLGIYQLMTSQFVPSDHADWRSAGEKELITDLELHQPMNIVSACGTPPYTNFTQGFQETLDYIFVDSDKLMVTNIVPMPSHEDVVANVALPSIVFPSDHLALICDMKFRE